MREPGDESDKLAFSRAQSLLAADDPVSALVILEELAGRDVPEAMGLLGLLLFLGRGCEPDGRRAEALLSRAAAAGIGTAAHNLGSLYLAGMPDVPRDRVRAAHFHRFARTLGVQAAPDEFYEGPAGELKR